MRKHFYLITDSPEEEFIGKVETTERPKPAAEKNRETRVDKRNLETNESYVEMVVYLGYADFESEDEYEENALEVMREKLTEIDENHLEKAGVDLEVAA